jgi:hypothetical protein
MELNMDMGEERKNKVDEEFAKVFHITACEFDEDAEFAKLFNTTDFEFDENKEDREFDKVFYTDKFEQDSDYQEVLCPLLRRGCNQGEFKAFVQQWSLYAGCHGGMDEREHRQQLLNCAVGPLEAVMYDTLGGKVDSLSETDLLEELEELAVVKTVTLVQAVGYPAMITEENPVQQPKAHSSPTRTHDQPALAMGNIANMTMDSTITELCYQYPGKMWQDDPHRQDVG